MPKLADNQVIKLLLQEFRNLQNILIVILYILFKI